MAQGSERLTLFRTSLAGLSRGEQKLIFSGLPPEFKAALWQDRLTHGIDALYGKEEKELITKILNKISIKSYVDEKERKVQQEFLTEIGSSAKELFKNFDEYNNLMTTLGDDPCPTQVIPPPGLPTCECSSEFSGGTSGSGNDCAALGRCQSGGCIPTNWGCGILWLWSCDGLCL